jgi:hypothetical protein
MPGILVCLFALRAHCGRDVRSQQLEAWAFNGAGT